MAKRPPSLIYSVDETPPVWTAIPLALQHVVVISAGWILPVVIVQASSDPIAFRLLIRPGTSSMIRCAFLLGIMCRQNVNGAGMNEP